MASNGAPSYGTPTDGTAPQYLPYRPPGMQQHQHQQHQHHQHQHQQHQHQQHQHHQQPPQQGGQHPGPTHGSGFQPPHQPHQAQGHYHPPADMNSTDMAPAPLRFQRKPVAGLDMPHHPTSHPPYQHQAGYFSPPTPAPSLYVADAGPHQPPPQQHRPYYPFSYASGSPTPPATQHWHAAQAHMAPGQPTPPAFYEMEAPSTGPLPGTFPAGSNATAVPVEPVQQVQSVQTFIAELPGSEPPGHSHVMSQSTSATPVSPSASIAGVNPSPSGGPQATQATEPGSVADSTSNLPGRGSEVERPKSPHHEVRPASPGPAVADSEGLIVVEKPPPPDHEGLIPFQAAAVPVPARSHPGYTHQSTPNTGPYQGVTGSPLIMVASGAQQPQWPPQAQQQHPSQNQTPYYGGPAPPDIQRPPSASPYPHPSTGSAHSAGRQTSNSPHLQQPMPMHQPPPSTAPAMASSYPQPTPTPASQHQTGPYQPPSVATPPPAAAAPLTSAYPSQRPHSATFSTAQSHSPSPAPQAPQMMTPPAPPASFSAQPQTPGAATYTPAAFPAKPHSFSAPSAPSGPPGPTYAGTFPVSHPSAIPSTPSITLSNHSISGAPRPQTSKPGRHSGASTSLGGFANSVFSKDTVKWSKKTASRFGGALKTAASSAHTAATNAQAAASQAAALHRQKSVAAAQMKAAASAPGNANGPTPGTGTGTGTPQLVTAGHAHTWPSPAGSSVAAPALNAPAYAQPISNPALSGIQPAAAAGGGLVYPPLQAQPTPTSTWPPGVAIVQGPAASVPPAQAGAGSQPGQHPHLLQQAVATPSYSQPPGGQFSHPNPQSWPPNAPIAANFGSTLGGPVPAPGVVATSEQSPQTLSPQAGAPASAVPQGRGGQIPQPQPGTPDLGLQQGPSAQFPQSSTGTPPLEKPQGAAEQNVQLSAPAHQLSPGPSVAAGTPNPGDHDPGRFAPPGETEVGERPGQLTQSRPGSPAQVNSQAVEGKPPQPHAVLPSSGDHPAGQPAQRNAQDQQPQPPPSGHASPPVSSPAAPAPVVAGQQVGGQPQQQAQLPHQPVNTLSQQHTWHPANSTTPAPMPMGPGIGQGAPAQLPQQQWGGPTQAWGTQTPGNAPFFPGQNVQHPQGAGANTPYQGPGAQPTQYPPFQQAQPAQYPQSVQPQAAGQQAYPWVHSLPNPAPYPGPSPSPAPGQSLATWQQPPPQWNAPAQQPAWGAVGSPFQGTPPYPQAQIQQQPVATWNHAPQQPPAWSPFPGAAPPLVSGSLQYATPGQAPVPPAINAVQYPPQGASPQSYGAVPQQFHWQGQPYAQGPVSPPQMVPTLQGMEATRHQTAPDSKGSFKTEHTQETGADDAHCTTSAVPAAATAGDVTAPTAGTQLATGDSGQREGGPGNATGGADATEAVAKDTVACGQGESGKSERADGQGVGNDSKSENQRDNIVSPKEEHAKE